MKNYKIREIAKKYQLEEIESHKLNGMSFLLDCTHYKLWHEDLYITDYDFREDRDLEEDNLFLLYFKRGSIFMSQKISGELIDYTDNFKDIIDEFYNECTTSQRFKHDCSQCRFLFQFKEYDLYYCESNYCSDKVVARYGNDGPEYISLEILLKRLTETDP